MPELLDHKVVRFGDFPPHRDIQKDCRNTSNFNKLPRCPKPINIYYRCPKPVQTHFVYYASCCSIPTKMFYKCHGTLTYLSIIWNLGCRNTKEECGCSRTHVPPLAMMRRIAKHVLPERLGRQSSGGGKWLF